MIKNVLEVVTLVKLLHVATLHIEFHIFTIRLKSEARWNYYWDVFAHEWQRRQSLPHSCLTLLNISSTVLDFYFKFVPDIHFPVQDTDTKFQTVSQKNQGVTSD
jgi:hypothetical protein